ncbi:MAG: MTH1187 family thiamine-binding protein [Candidatus Brocadiales bacterium]|nr:MTH1187 family thiamine-binding protein [Candidatus Brocadiales bacterium]
MIADFRMVPIGGKSVHLHSALAKALKPLVESGANYQVNDMCTTVEGDWNTVMGLIKKCHDKMLETNDRVTTMITIDDRKDIRVHIGDKVKSIEKELGKPLKK